MTTNEQGVPWPSTEDGSHSPVGYRNPLQAEGTVEHSLGANGRPGLGNKSSHLTERRLGTWNLIALSISMLGVQMSWTIELAYGTPYLLGLGVSDQMTSLVWLAGPLSGLIAQPLIGALSDSSNSRFRRRSWIIGSTVILVATGLLLAYSTDLAFVLLTLCGTDANDPQKVRNTAIPIAIVAFYLFDFAINGIQASLRNLLLDVTPQDQLSLANSWQGRMLHAGSIIGNGLGFWDLSQVPILRLLRGNQFRKLCVLAMVILVISVCVTCATQVEKKGRQSFQTNKTTFLKAVSTISHAIVDLPRPIRRVCYVQIFSWIGWFPFLFYATVYVGQVMALEIGTDPSNDIATRAGEFALFLYSVVAVISGTILPYFASRDHRLLARDDDDDNENAEISRIRELVQFWKSEAARQGKPLKLPTMPFMLRNIWTSSLLLFSILMLSTFFIKTVFWATVMITLCGICWAITCWVPFAILMEYLKEIDSGAVKEAQAHAPSARPVHVRALSTPAFQQRGQRMKSNERVPLLRRYSLMVEGELPLADDLSQSKKPLAGGTVLGIHNLGIVFPQFIVSFVASIIFKVANRNANESSVYYGKTGVSWVLRFGGLSAMVAALISRMVPPTKTEKEMRRRLAEMSISNQRGSI